MLGKLAEPRARRAELVRQARDRALREQLLAEARLELAATRKAA